MSKQGSGTERDSWKLTTPSGKSTYEVWRDPTSDPPALVCQVGRTRLSYQLRCIEDLHAKLGAHGDWMLLGSADEKKPTRPDTVEHWGRSEANPIGGWYGIRKGYRGRFANDVPPVLGVLGLAEVEHKARNNRMRAK